ncbi:glucosylglycerate hydrolase [Pseudonocardia nigra]|uniref:glucosylglycerate hydrolase n=1 Tax=Pseudonocardia nigra TaxID=1921578 RepID=UPI001C5D9E01|nr:glycoside hydrolase 100 family protein [Pseudonocardia nigra]
MLNRCELVARAAYVLRGNSTGSMTRAAPDLYPHQWSWDAAFVAVGLAHLDVPRSCAELDSLFAGQWRTGMLPHIVFDPHANGYFPGPDRWACANLTDDAPTQPRTSGVCQPPVHALAVERIADVAAYQGGAAAAHVKEWLPSTFDRLLAWHRYLARRRDPDGDGLLTVYHGWESGMDNSPRWDAVYSRVTVGAELPLYARWDIEVVVDPSQRPTSAEYDRYLWIVERLKLARYDDAEVRRTAEFLATDVFASAVFAVANEALADLATRLGRPEGAELREAAERFRRGVAGALDPGSGLAVDTDLLTGAPLPAETCAGFAPLVCGGLDAEQEREMLALLRSPQWTGHPALRHPVLPTTSPSSPDFRPRAYWRGPSWPVMNWFVAWMLARRGVTDVAEALRRAALAELSEGSLAEYYEPMTGEPLGSVDQSWSAAATLDLVLTHAWSD